MFDQQKDNWNLIKSENNNKKNQTEIESLSSSAL